MTDDQKIVVRIKSVDLVTLSAPIVAEIMSEYDIEFEDAIAEAIAMNEGILEHDVETEEFSCITPNGQELVESLLKE